EFAVLRRPDANRVGHLRAAQRSSRDARGAAIDRLAVHERVAIRHSYRIHVARIHVIEVANIGVVEHVRVTYESIAGIDVSDVSATAVVPRVKRFAKAQGKPADSDVKPAAKKPDEGGSVNRTAIIRPRAPAPPAPEIIPAAIVVGRETPGRIVNPGPAPRANPVPIAVAVRSPVNRNFARIPNVAVFWFIAPVAVIIQVAVAGHIARDIFPRNGV